MKKLMKILHSLGAIGLTGGYLAYLLLALKGAHLDPAALVVVRANIEWICSWLLIPSMALVLMSGLLSIAAHHPFANAVWVWIKTVSGIAVFEGTFGVQSHAKDAAGLAIRAAAGDLTESAQLAEQAHTEKLALLFLLFIALGNVVIGIWRPRFHADSKTAPTTK